MRKKKRKVEATHPHAELVNRVLLLRRKRDAIDAKLMALCTRSSEVRRFIILQEIEKRTIEELEGWQKQIGYNVIADAERGQ